MSVDTLSVLDLAERIIENKYRMLRLLSVDPRGALYEAELLDPKAPVAIKALFPDVQIDPAASLSFSHPNIVRIHEAICTADQQYFVVTDRPRGKSLRAILDATSKVSLGPAISTALQLLSALHAIHQTGRVCQNVNPDNIFVTLDKGRSVHICLLDVGVANAAGVPDNPYYLSPEQIVGEGHVDRRSDLWAIGVVLYEMLFGGRPFNGDNQDEISSRILLKDPPVPKRTTVPRELITMISKALSKDPQDRYQDAGAMIGDLMPLHQTYGEALSPSVAGALRDSIPPPPAGAGLLPIAGDDGVTRPVSAPPEPFPVQIASENSRLAESTAKVAVRQDLLDRLNDPALVGDEAEEGDLLERLTTPGEMFWADGAPPPVQIRNRRGLTGQWNVASGKLRKGWFYTRENGILGFRHLREWLETPRHRVIFAALIGAFLLVTAASAAVLMLRGSADESAEPEERVATDVAPQPSADAPKPSVSGADIGATVGGATATADAADTETSSESGAREDREAANEAVDSAEIEIALDDVDGEDAAAVAEETADSSEDSKEKSSSRRARKKRRQKSSEQDERKTTTKKRRVRKANWASNPFED